MMCIALMNNQAGTISKTLVILSIYIMIFDLGGI